MVTSSRIQPSATVSTASEHHVVRQMHITLRYMFTLVPVVAGIDKFTNLLAQWDRYLNPLALSVVPVTAPKFMHIVGVIEIIAGILVFVRPRLGGFVVMGWLLAIALQLILWGHFLDVAVRDIVMALSGPLILARLSPFINPASGAGLRAIASDGPQPGRAVL